MNNLYMTTEEFAAMVVDTLHEQNYFKKGKKSHPADIVIAFVSTAETIATTMEWAIKKIHDINLDQKIAVLRTGNLSKNTSGSWSTDSSETVNPTIATKVEPALLKEGEPLITEDALGYSEWKRDGYL